MIYRTSEIFKTGHRLETLDEVMVHPDGVCRQRFPLLGESMLITCRVDVIIIILIFKHMNSSLEKLSVFTATNLNTGVWVLSPFLCLQPLFLSLYFLFGSME